jgi:hypothetical protein
MNVDVLVGRTRFSFCSSQFSFLVCKAYINLLVIVPVVAITLPDCVFDQHRVVFPLLCTKLAELCSRNKNARDNIYLSIRWKNYPSMFQSQFFYKIDILLGIHQVWQRCQWFPLGVSRLEFGLYNRPESLCSALVPNFVYVIQNTLISD